MKTGKIPEQATASGLPEARERFRRDRMNDADRQEYDAHIEALRYQKSVIQTGLIEGRADGLAEGRAEGRTEGLIEGKVEGRTEEKTEIALKMLNNSVSVDIVCKYTGLSNLQIEELINKML